MRIFVSTILLTLGLTLGAVNAEETSETRQKSLELMTVIGGEAMINQIMDAALSQAFELERSKLNSEQQLTFDLYRRASKEAMSDLVPEFMSEIAAIYERHFTVAEMDAVIDFYKSPAGEKLIAKLPELTAESIVVGTAFGEKLAARLTTLELPESLNE